jgi:dTDP-glucose 4,6-dehydratase
LTRGKPGSTYNVGGGNEKTNLEVVNTICAILDELSPDSRFAPRASLITFVKDRPGHDRRYAMNIGKIRHELGWHPMHDFANGVRKTVRWYLENTGWVEAVLSGEYKKWIDMNYGNRGLA